MVMDLPLPVPLLKNSSSAGRMGRGLSMGIQYLQEARSESTVKGVKQDTKLHATDSSAQFQQTSFQ